jgi:hypothetical protein
MVRFKSGSVVLRHLTEADDEERECSAEILRQISLAAKGGRYFEKAEFKNRRIRKAQKIKSARAGQKPTRADVQSQQFFS